MSERDKMLAGELYDCGDPQLLAQWHKAKDLVRDYNQTDSLDLKEKDMSKCETETFALSEGLFKDSLSTFS